MIHRARILCLLIAENIKEQKTRKEKRYMTFDKFTIKAQEAVQEAVNTATRNGQQIVEPVHLLTPTR